MKATAPQGDFEGLMNPRASNSVSWSCMWRDSVSSCRRRGFQRGGREFGRSLMIWSSLRLGGKVDNFSNIGRWVFTISWTLAGSFCSSSFVRVVLASSSMFTTAGSPVRLRDPVVCFGFGSSVGGRNLSLWVSLVVRSVNWNSLDPMSRALIWIVLIHGVPRMMGSEIGATTAGRVF